MKKVLSLGLVLFMGFLGSISAQVIADFEADDGGFAIGWGNTVTSVYQTTDPSGVSSGVLAMDFDASGSEQKGAVNTTGVEAGAARMVTFYLWIPEDAPDSILIKPFVQDNNWTWADYKLYVDDVVKATWFPVHFDLEAMHIMNPSFDINEGKLQRVGVELSTWDLEGDELTWTGTIYMDNVSLVGAEPEVLADFEANDGGFSIGWGDFITGLAQVADPSGVSTGVLEVSLDADVTTENKGAMNITGVEAAGFKNATFYLWIPDDVPGAVDVKVFAQDQNWTWADYKFTASDAVRNSWYPFHFDFEAMHIMNPGFDLAEGKLQRLGIEFGTWSLSGADTLWNGKIYVDNTVLMGTETGEKYVVADFENEAGGTQGFTNTGWGPMLTGVQWAADPSGVSTGVLQTIWNFTGGSSNKGAFEVSGISLYSEEADTFASAITIDVWLPADIPQGAQVSIFARNPWSEEQFFITDSTLLTETWNTLVYDVAKHIANEGIDPMVSLSVGCQIYYSNTEAIWAGNVYWDNLTLVGIPEPLGEVVSPPVTTEILTSTGSVPSYDYVQINWIDNNVGNEKYNVYMSINPITSLDDPGVIRMTNAIPHGEEYWVHRPWTTSGEEATFYYAVTAVDVGGVETDLNDDCTAGPVTVTNTSPTAKAYYNENFSSEFVLDGLNTEFVQYDEYKLVPENANGDESAGWTIESTDMSWATTFVIDDDYLYISANVVDDDLNAEGGEPAYSGTQPWMGDALEFFIGYYDINVVGDYHNYRDVDAIGTGDWRIAFTGWGTTGTATVNDREFPGVETTVYESFFGDGYIIEARIALDSLALDNDITVLDGTRMPMQINGNDMDFNLNQDSSRTLQANWGGQSGHEVWLRPGGWGFLEVINGPTAIDKDMVTPLTYELYSNYPNPFNPATTIRYQLAEATDVTVEVYDILGHKIATLVNAFEKAGKHDVTWNGMNSAGKMVSSGIYFYKLSTAGFTKTHKMMLLR